MTLTPAAMVNVPAIWKIQARIRDSVKKEQKRRFHTISGRPEEIEIAVGSDCSGPFIETWGDNKTSDETCRTDVGMRRKLLPSFHVRLTALQVGKIRIHPAVGVIERSPHIPDCNGKSRRGRCRI